jgi:hypothetical protein
MEPLHTDIAPLLYLDYDGVLHHENVRFVETTGQFQLVAPTRYRLFEHLELLERLLEPFPSVRIVLSTRWTRLKPLPEVSKELLPSLRSRVIGSFVPPAAPADFWTKPKGQQVAEDVERRAPCAWLALDDDQIGWPAWSMPHVIFTDPYEGISPPEAQDAIRRQLAAVVKKARS